MLREELYRLLRDQEFTIEDIIDAIIQLNGIVGVGRISLGDTLQQYCHVRAKDYQSKGVMNKNLKSGIVAPLETSDPVGMGWGGQVWQSNHRNGTT